MIRLRTRASVVALATAALLGLGLPVAISLGSPVLAAETSPVAAGGTAVVLPPQLKHGSLIEDDTIRIGDLWDHVGDKAQVPLAKAPDPGKRISFESRWLAAVARAYGIDWRPATSFERATIERAGRTVDIRAIETELREALRMEGAAAGVSIELANRNSLRVMIPTRTEPVIGVRDLEYDPRMNRFSAVIEVPAGAINATQVKVSGSVFASASIPVLTHAMSRGDIITDKDIEIVEMREEMLRRDIVTSPTHLIGQEVRYPIRAGAPVRVSEVQKPVAVAKNSAVTMSVRTSVMTLTAQGRAVEDGSVGDVIRVTNVHSRQIVDARVIGPGQVVVIPPSQRAAMAAGY